MSITLESKIAGLIRELLSDGKPRTARQIADEIHRDISKVNEYLRIARTPGRRQEVRAFDRGGNCRSVRYVCGKGENADVRRSPVSQSRIEKEKENETRLDRKHQRDGRRFPKVDPVLLNAINSMVRMGART